VRFAAVADIHGNALALEAVLADIRAQGITEIVNLGDSLSGPLEPARCADILMELDLPTVLGNHDRYLVDYAPSEMHEWEVDTFSLLETRHLEWLSGLPPTRVWRDEVFLCHATPADDNRYWLHTVNAAGQVCRRRLSEVEGLAAGVEQKLILCGHTHLAAAATLSDGRLIVNPGSVGCPAYDDDAPCYHRVEAGTPFASYAVLELAGDRWLPSFRLVGYDNRAMSRLAASRGRQAWSRALNTGWL
jgi:predicted phosphodiesterase